MNLSFLNKIRNISTCWLVDWLKSLFLNQCCPDPTVKRVLIYKLRFLPDVALLAHSIQTQLLFKSMSNCAGLGFQTLPKDKRRPSAHSNVKGKFRWTGYGREEDELPVMRPMFIATVLEKTITQTFLGSFCRENVHALFNSSIKAHLRA